MNGGVVELDVENCPPVVFNGIFDGSEDDNDDEGYGAEDRIIDTKDGEELEAGE